MVVFGFPRSEASCLRIIFKIELTGLLFLRLSYKVQAKPAWSVCFPAPLGPVVIPITGYFIVLVIIK